MIKFLNKSDSTNPSHPLRLVVKRSLSVLVVGLLSTPVWSIDVGAAEQLAKDSGCTKCHAVDRKKDGPAYRDVAAKFRGAPDAEAKIMHHITSGEKVKFPDGHKEDHKKIKTKDPAEIKNLIAWILALEGGTKY